MPEWLLENDNYIPEKDSVNFINKSILAILNILTRIRLQSNAAASKLGVNDFTKLVSVLLMIIFVSLSKSITYVLIANVFLLVLINVLNIDEIKYVLKVSFVMAVITLLILLPSILLGYGNNALMITLKVFSSVAFVNILSCSTKWNDLLVALKLFKVPDLFIFVLDITIKYIILLGEFSLSMIYALKLRSVGKNNSKNASLSGIVGTMFIKSKEMSEEMYGAMECRGFTGEYRAFKKFKFSLADFICIIVMAAFVLTYFKFNSF
ncbi:energy-coupling factor transporter transmembrane component T family protein [Candidatus Clostridium radicumherbarum]|uniref:Energy-coupling factor transporter transmembrane component T family protein n=1 Tax=Candidatus Clostridium radicumherbarum TaxID=3381662 RepID=A0ABW8TUE5_9CLOT